MRKPWVLRKYLVVLPRKLLEDYGHGGPFTPKQIESTIERYMGWSVSFCPYAQAMFCDETALDNLQRETCQDFRALRRELGGAYFGGRAHFTLRDVHRYSADHGYGDGGGYGGDEGGGHHGGDGGGHGGDGGGGH